MRFPIQQIQKIVEAVEQIVNGACHNDCIAIRRQNVYMSRSMIFGQCKVCTVVRMIVVGLFVIYLLLDFQRVVGIG